MIAVLAIGLFGFAADTPAAANEQAQLTLSCPADHDLWRVLRDNGVAARRFDTVTAALEAAPSGSGVLILAAGYPDQPTAISDPAYALAKEKRLRLYVEFPERLPRQPTGQPAGGKVERAVVTSDFFGPPLPPLRLLGLNGLRYVNVSATNAHLVAARVAGFDTAIYGLPKVTHPLLFQTTDTNLLVATTALSRFVTGRYAPSEAWATLWRRILNWLAPEAELPALRWTPMVRPSYGRDEPLPAEAEKEALRRGVDWFARSKLLLHPSRLNEINQAAQRDGLLPTPPANAPVGDGTPGILEAPLSIIQSDGSQVQSVARRGDCTAESAMALAFGGTCFNQTNHSLVARNLLDFYYFTSDARQHERADPNHGAYGLIAWGITTPAWSVANYGDDNARLLLGTMASAALLGTDRWDEAMMMCLLGNLRTTGRQGFRSDRLDLGPLGQRGWRHFYHRNVINLAPHFEAYLWACNLWAYHKTGDDLFLKRTLRAIRLTMQAYPKGLRWTNGLAQERARLLLPLAWLVRVQDTPEHREWLRQAVEGLLSLQQPSGGIREELGPPGQGMMPPPRSNEEYGLAEASLIQQNGDPVADMLYTVNFAFLGLHEATAALNDPGWLASEEKLAKFLVRIQIRSEARPELDGGWFRAFDMGRWEAWASNADAGWGAWAIESGWTQGWITSVLALRQMKSSLWDLTAGSKIGKHFAGLRQQMMPEEELEAPQPWLAPHAAQGKPYELATPPSPSYPDEGLGSLTDGELGSPDHTDPAWMGWEGPDFSATLDLGETIVIRQMAIQFLESVPVGVYLPARVEFSTSQDGQAFAPLKTIERPPARDQKPWIHRFAAENLNTPARYVCVQAKNPGRIAPGRPGAGANSWLFVDEVLVNPGQPSPRTNAPATAVRPPHRDLSLTLVPPSLVTEQVTLDVRAGLWHRSPQPKSFEVEFFLDREDPAHRLHQATLEMPARSNRGIQFRWPSRGQAGRHRVLLVARSGAEVWRESQPLEIVASSARSTARIAGAWAGIYHWSEQEGRLWNAEIKRMTEDDWRDLVRGMHQVGLNMLVGGESFRNQVYVGQHSIEQNGYAGKAFYPSRLYPGRMRITATDPFEAILSEADRLEMHVFMPVGLYAWFDYTPASLAWHEEVAEELWERYGHHPSFYGWYITEEIAGNLGTDDTRRRQIVEFFHQFRAHVRRLAPDKPVLLAPNCHTVRQGLAFYPELLQSLDILCPFGFHRMPAGDLQGEEVAALLQKLCDEAGTHLWMDLEVFLFAADMALYPRPIEGLASDLRRFPNFEAILCYQYPGLMTAPDASRKLGGDAAVKLFQDYQGYLAEAGAAPGGASKPRTP